MSKERITVSVDPELIAAGAAAVAEGNAESMSAWVNEAMADKADKDRRLRALGDFLSEYEAEHGRFTDEELAAQREVDARLIAASHARIEKRRSTR